MIRISDYRDYWVNVMERLPIIKRVVFARTEDELRDRIKKIANKEVFLVSVIPSADVFSPDHDNIRERETCIVYILIKVARSNQTESDVITDMQVTQDTITQLKRHLLADSENHDFQYHQFLKEIDFAGMHTDPEFNYLECDGYSISFKLITNNF